MVNRLILPQHRQLLLLISVVMNLTTILGSRQHILSQHQEQVCVCVSHFRDSFSYTDRWVYINSFIDTNIGNIQNSELSKQLHKQLFTTVVNCTVRCIGLFQQQN